MFLTFEFNNVTIFKLTKFSYFTFFVKIHRPTKKRRKGKLGERNLFNQ